MNPISGSGAALSWMILCSVKLCLGEHFWSFWFHTLCVHVCVCVYGREESTSCTDLLLGRTWIRPVLTLVCLTYAGDLSGMVELLEVISPWFIPGVVLPTQAFGWPLPRMAELKRSWDSWLPWDSKVTIGVMRRGMWPGCPGPAFLGQSVTGRVRQEVSGLGRGNDGRHRPGDWALVSQARPLTCGPQGLWLFTLCIGDTVSVYTIGGYIHFKMGEKIKK